MSVYIVYCVTSGSAAAPETLHWRIKDSSVGVSALNRDSETRKAKSATGYGRGNKPFSPYGVCKPPPPIA